MFTDHYAITDSDEVSFRIDSWDHTHALVIDPTIVYSTLFGGGLSTNYGEAIQVDSSGNILIAGYTYAADFPTVNASQSGIAGSGSYDAFVTKINPAGTALIYSTYLGGSSYDYAQAIAVDSSGSAWVTGYTQSSDFPTLNAAQSTYGGGGSYDAFVTRLSASGVLQFSTFLGGSGYDEGYGVSPSIARGTDTLRDTRRYRFRRQRGLFSRPAYLSRRSRPSIHRQVRLSIPRCLAATVRTKATVSPRIPPAMPT